MKVFILGLIFATANCQLDYEKLFGGDYYADYKNEENWLDVSPEPPKPKPARPLTLPASQSLQQFTFDLLNQMSEGGSSSENIILSPLSIYTALAMLRPGLTGHSLDEVNRVMRMDDITSDDLTEMYSTLFERNSNYKLMYANRVYVDRSVRLKKKYKKEITSLNATQARRLDISGSTERSRLKINKYVRKRTRKLIAEILPAGSLSEASRLVLVNALYLKASWKIGFKLSQTRWRKFWLSPKLAINVPTMYHPEYQCTIYHDDVTRSDVTVFSLADSISMMMIMPEEAGNFSHIYDNSDGTMVEKIGNIISSVWQEQNNGEREIEMCQVTMPKFKLDYDVKDTKSLMRRMGVKDIFEMSNANLTRMSNFDSLYVQDIRHKAKIRTTEQGVEAAGATTVTISIRSVVSRFQKINKPFYYLLRHDATGAILFAGKVVNPIG